MIVRRQLESHFIRFQTFKAPCAGQHVWVFAVCYLYSHTRTLPVWMGYSTIRLFPEEEVVHVAHNIFGSRECTVSHYVWQQSKTSEKNENRNEKFPKNIEEKFEAKTSAKASRRPMSVCADDMGVQFRSRQRQARTWRSNEVALIYAVRAVLTLGGSKCRSKKHNVSGPNSAKYSFTKKDNCETFASLPLVQSSPKFIVKREKIPLYRNNFGFSIF